MSKDTRGRGRGRLRALNPFQRLETEAEVRSAARGGAVVSGYLALNYAVQVLFLTVSGKDLYDDAGPLVLGIDATAIVLASFLAWRIWTRQGLVSAVLVAVWFAVELVMKIGDVADGRQTTNPGWIFVFAALTFASILSIRGAWALRRHKPVAQEN